ncbi:hypothetical protein TSUD_398900, partial [Trifolium subterraneum]
MPKCGITLPSLTQMCMNELNTYLQAGSMHN